MDWEKLENQLAGFFRREWRKVDGGRVLLPVDLLYFDQIAEGILTDEEWDAWLEHDSSWREHWRARPFVAIDIEGGLAPWSHVITKFETGDGRVYLLDDLDVEVGEAYSFAAIDPGSCDAATNVALLELVASGGECFGISFGRLLEGRLLVYDEAFVGAVQDGLARFVETLDPQVTERLLGGHEGPHNTDITTFVETKVEVVRASE